MRLERVGLIGRIAVAAVAFAIIIGAGYAWATYKNFTAHVPHGDPVPSWHGTDIDGDAQNVLLIGNDSRAGATRAEQNALHVGHDDTTVNTDTMMILHVPTDGRRPALMSFPRDSWVNIPGHGKGKLNSAYSDAYNAAIDHHKSQKQAESDGILLTLRTLEQLTGLRIDHYVQIDLLGFYRISNAIGGVQVCLLHAQNPQTETDGTRHGFSGINLPKGVSTIKGAMALAFVRQRHGLPHGDLDRIRRQQYFLASALHKVASSGMLLNPFKLRNLLDAVQPSLLTDPALNLISLAHSFELLSAGQLSFSTLPNNGPQLIYPDGVATSIVAVDYPAIHSFVQSFIGHRADLSGVRAARPSQTVVDVLNGADVFRLATRNARALRRLHFRVDTIDSTEQPVTATAIQYPPARAAQAKAVAAVVPGAQLVPTGDVHRVTLVLGSDGKQVTGVAAAAPTATPSPSGTPSPGTSSPPAKTPAKPVYGLGCIN